MKLIAENVNNLLRKIFSRRDPILAEIIINWSKIVGLKFSQNANPFKISRIKEKGNNINVLHVQVANASLSMEMSFQQEIIIERLSVYLGFKAINRIKLVIIGH